jgi:hypothetical protein
MGIYNRMKSFIKCQIDAAICCVNHFLRELQFFFKVLQKYTQPEVVLVTSGPTLP